MVQTSMSDLARHDRIRREVLQNSDRIPSLDAVVTEVLRLLGDPDTDIVDFEKPLLNDAPLVGRMLQIVNSPFYGLSRQITSIVDAINILGFRGLRSLVLASSTGKFLGQDYSCYGFDQQGLWCHSLCVAAAAKHLAGSLGLGRNLTEEVFVAGLLHDIGKMLLGPYLTGEGVELAHCAAAACEVERQVCGTDHQEAGVVIAKKWKLSPLVQHVLENHGGDGGPEEYLIPIAVVRLSDSLSHRFGKGYKPDFEIPSTPLSCDLGWLGLDEEDWAEMQEGMVEAMRDAVISLGSLGS